MEMGTIAGRRESGHTGGVGSRRLIPALFSPPVSPFLGLEAGFHCQNLKPSHVSIAARPRWGRGAGRGGERFNLYSRVLLSPPPISPHLCSSLW